MIEKSTVVLQNYNALTFLDASSKVFLERMSVTNLLDRLTWNENEIDTILDIVSDYQILSKKDLVKVFRNRGE